jgi:hypothetical protein
MSDVIEVKKTELIAIARKSGVINALSYADKFLPYAQEFSEIEEMARSLNFENPGTDDVEVAKTLKSRHVKNRKNAEDTKTTEKEESIKVGNLIQSFYNVIKASSEFSELQLNKIIKHAELAENAKRDVLEQSRIARLAEFEIDTKTFGLRDMADEVFENLFVGLKTAHEKRKNDEAESARVEAENAQKEKDRQAEILNENKRLKDEANERDRLAAIDKAAADEKLRAERESAEKIKKNQDAIIEYERGRAQLAENALQRSRPRAIIVDAIGETVSENPMTDSLKIQNFINDIRAVIAPETEKLETQIVVQNARNMLDGLCRQLEKLI